MALHPFQHLLLSFFFFSFLHVSHPSGYVVEYSGDFELHFLDDQ